MKQNIYHIIASHSRITCDSESQQERSMEQETTIRVYTKDLNVIKTFMAKKRILKTADGVRIAIEYANAHGALK